MFADDNEPRVPQDAIRIGQDLSLLSVDELHQRIRILEGEIERIRKDIDAKSGHKLQAEAVFSRK
ncbi:hypothetical protein GCM10007276_15150 [Agaricicola taiwanensis]|uniref:DUF1192 domain-containing protein n=1 Tax=Agaricicola taiwanensis TaxID=591372 RepID=A0A8J2YD30_9RHOB|nr:DUF1192 domain-containing protein [Agaricicola taiwanensis]GGE38806.1 hypothetical protein GCM10007276_15150 [Agaricicola taiwanensis]